MRKWLNSIFLILSICVSAFSFGQAGHYWYERNLQSDVEYVMMQDNAGDHFSVKPFSLRDIAKQALVNDSSRIGNDWANSFWVAPDSNKWAIDFTPLLQAEMGYTNDVGGVYTAAPGLAMHIRYGNHISLYTDFVGGAYQGPNYIEQFIDTTGVIPSLGKDRADLGAPAFILPTARLAYTPSEYFQFELGYGKNFFGQGYRSMFLSDVAYNYPFLKIETDVWKLKYVNLYSKLDGTNPTGTNPGSFQDKYSTTHYLSWAISPRFNIGFFETIVWQSEDSLSNRGFDVNYLNPIIFYRTVEFSLGSPDNALLGIDLSFKASKKVLIYGQLLLDEFLLKEVRARSGWWANKWGTQIGFKSFDSFGQEGLRIQAEVNIARPFTYSHGSVLQNFGHYNQPLAHQLGTNFYEGYLTGYYEKGDWYGEVSFMYAAYGRDPDTLNLGGDIYKSYENPAKQYGNEIGQGIATHLYYQKLSAGLILNRDLNLRVGLDYTFRHQNTRGAANLITHMVGVHFITRLSNTYHDF